MRNFAHSHLPTRNIAIVGLMLTVFIFFAALVPTGLMLAGSQPAYTNKTQTQQWEDIQKLLSDRRNACNDAGGLWIQRDCTHSYSSPDESWYVIPDNNEWQTVTVVTGMLVAVFGFILAFACPLFAWGEAQSKRERLRQERNAEILFSLGTP